MILKTHMTRHSDIALTALAPIIWGSTYFVTTEFLPQGYPVTMAMLRALPAGLLLLILVRELPRGIWWLRMLILGALNFTIFWTLLFVAAYKLPGGVAATVGAIQPLIVIFLAHLMLTIPVQTKSILAALAGIFGVALLVLSPSSALDPLGIAAGLGGAASMATGSVLTRKWQPPTSLLTYTAWQLTAGGLLLVPLAFWLEPALPPLSLTNLTGLVWLSLFGAVFTYLVWFRGITKIELSVVSMLGFLSPTAAVIIGWTLLDEHLTALQITGALIVLASIWFSQHTSSAPIKARISKQSSLNIESKT